MGKEGEGECGYLLYSRHACFSALNGEVTQLEEDWFLLVNILAARDIIHEVMRGCNFFRQPHLHMFVSENRTHFFLVFRRILIFASTHHPRVRIASRELTEMLSR